MEKIEKGMSFRCRTCGSVAGVIMKDSRIGSVLCSACGISVEGDKAQRMYRDLIDRSRLQNARKISRDMIRRESSFRVPKAMVDTEFSDQKWPFVLVVE